MHSSKHPQQGSALFIVVSGLAIAAIFLFLLVELATSGYYADVAESTDKATQTRIMPAGNIVMGDGTEPGQRTGEQVFNKVCIQCHGADKTVAYSPKVTHNDQWAPRIAQGFNTLVKHAIEGYTGKDGGIMPAKGGDTSLTDDEVARAVAYMANQSGAQFSAPEPTPSASGAADPDQAKVLFEKTCQACHGADSAIPFAPKITHADQWAPRIKQGKETLFKHAIEGYTGKDGGIMPARGGSNYSDDEIKMIVTYMVQQSGGKL